MVFVAFIGLLSSREREMQKVDVGWFAVFFFCHFWFISPVFSFNLRLFFFFFFSDTETNNIIMLFAKNLTVSV